MATIRTCDKCHKIINDEYFRIEIYHHKSDKSETTILSELEDGGYIAYDLCQTCKDLIIIV